MTEIPEHLLKRSQAARTKATGEAAPDAPAAAPAEASNAPVPAGAATAPAPKPATPPAVPAAPVVKPDLPVVAAAKSRNKMPFWAMMALAMLPLWVFMYVRGLTPKEPKVTGPLGEGAALYAANCSGCHGSKGEGGAGYAFAGGEVLKTFPHIEDQLRWVDLGTGEYQKAGIAIYGNPERPGGPHNTGAKGIMPNFGPSTGGALTEAEILAVVCHERFTLGGADPKADYAEEYEKWCSPEAPAWLALEDGSATFADIDTKVEGAIKVGTEPAAGSAPAKP